MKSLRTIPLFLLLAFCSLSFVSSESVRVIRYPELLEIMESPGEGVLIVNFWATWCGPCVKELPYFEAANNTYRDRGVKTLLVSMDDVDKLNEKVVPFVKKKGLKSEVVLLNETDFNAFINKVDKRWSGAIPATLIIDQKTGRRIFIGEAVEEGELDKYIANFIK